MKKTFIWIIIIILALIVIFALTKKDKPSNNVQENTNTSTNMSSNITKVTYTGEKGNLEATYNADGTSVTFSTEETGEATLPVAISGSGARYANADESLVFWEHQGELTITKDGKDIYKGNIVQNQ